VGTFEPEPKADKPVEWRARPIWVRMLPGMGGVAFVYLARWIFGSPAGYAVVAAGLLVLVVVQLTRQRSR